MQAVTLPPWLSSWAGAYGRERARARQRARARLTIYTLGREDAAVLRLAPPGWPSPRPRERLSSLASEPWHLALPPPRDDLYPEHVNLAWAESTSHASPGAARGGGGGARVWGGGGGSSWGAGGAACAAAAALLALLLLLARAADSCIDNRLLKRRRRSQEWPTPNVLATSHMEEDTLMTPAGAAPRPARAPAPSADLPPPYSACGSAPFPPKLRPEEPPPPYSAYVEFSNKPPAVLVVSRRALGEGADEAGSASAEAAAARGATVAGSGSDGPEGNTDAEGTDSGGGPPRVNGGDRERVIAV